MSAADIDLSGSPTTGFRFGASPQDVRINRPLVKLVDLILHDALFRKGARVVRFQADAHTLSVSVVVGDSDEAVAIRPPIKLSQAVLSRLLYTTGMDAGADRLDGTMTFLDRSLSAKAKRRAVGWEMTLTVLA